MKIRAINPNGTLIQPYETTEQRLPTDRPIVQYIRQSTKRQQKQNKVSGAMQDIDMKRNLLSRGWTDELILPAIDEDTTKSGTKRADERTGLAKLYDLIAAGKIGAIAAYNASRIYRTLSKAELGRFCDAVKENGLPVVTARRVYWPNETDNKALLADFQAAADYIEDHIKGVVIAAKNYHIETNTSWGGNAVPMGYIVTSTEIIGADGEPVERKYYVAYEEHARLVRWLYRRFRELSGNLPLLARELKQMDFRFPAFEKGITPHVGLHADADGTYPLRNRDAIISLLTNRAYIGWYIYNGVLVSREAHEPIVELDDFMYAWKQFNSVSPDGTEEQEKIARERRYGGVNALLDGVVRSGGLPVYVMKERYTAWTDIDGFNTIELVVPVNLVDSAFSRAMVASLVALERAHRRGLQDDLYARVEALRQEQEKRAHDYTDTLARIDQEIRSQEMAQRISREEGDEQGYRTATRQLVGLRKDREAVEAKSKQASSEASELAECHGLIDCAMCQWETMPIHKQKKLVKLLVASVNMVEVSPHFIRLDVAFNELVRQSMSVFIYRTRGSWLTWSNEDLATFTRMYPQASRQEIMEALPTRSWDALKKKAAELGLSRSWQQGDSMSSSHRMLCHDDFCVMFKHGARLDMPVWTIESSDVEKAHLWGADSGQLTHPSHWSG